MAVRYAGNLTAVDSMTIRWIAALNQGKENEDIGGKYERLANLRN